MIRFWWLWLILFAAATGGGVVVYNMTRGLRNNNPGNIRKSADQWQGLASEQTDGAFFQFTDPRYGIRAMTRILRNYQSRYGLSTVRGIISRWAPDNENNTESYIASVASALGVGPDQTLNLIAAMPDLVAAIIKHENGVQPYDVVVIREGISWA